MTSVNDVLPIVLGAGGAGFIAAAAQAVTAWRNGAEARESRALANLERWRDEAEARANGYLTELDHERAVADYWRQRAAVLAYALNLAGLPIPPAEPQPNHNTLGSES